ncbi:hypothetical protein GIB67_021154 [Kingdonia uniflora]|uniref:Formin-like protein n=1 Tax=Kingdonia uniflora TaxID=39325 RepID=A0A7J7N783_9MAGN|nr:hypothetical protein GIB67_021154 [Kingdonia uniflora]
MDVRRFGCGAVFIVLVCALGSGSSEGRTRGTDKFSFFLKNGALEIDDNMAEQLWINCRLELHFPSKTRPITKRNLEKASSILSSQMKQTILYCLRENNIPFRVSGEDDESKSWYMRYLELIFSWPNTSRRYLGQEILLAPVPAPEPSVQPPTFSPEPSFAPKPSFSLRSSFAPEPSFAPAPASHEDSDPPALAEVPQSYYFPQSFDFSEGPSNPDYSPNLPSEKSHGRTKVFIALAVTAAGTFLLTVLLLFCYCKCRKNTDLGYGKKDASPLLTLSLSNFSAVSSEKSALANSNNKEKIGTPSFSTNPSANGRASSMGIDMSMESNIQNSSLLQDPSTGAIEGAIAGTCEPAQPLKFAPGSLPPPPPIPSATKPGPGRPPPPTPALLPPRLPAHFPINLKVPPPSRFGLGKANDVLGSKDEAGAPKTKLKPFFWDKVAANSNNSMVWHQLNAGSFQFNEEMIETLFGAPVDKNKNERRKDLSQDPGMQYIRIIDSKKAQNLSILLRALNVTTEEVCDALQEGDQIPVELLQTLLKMAPTEDEELKLRLYCGELSLLGPAERFLKFLIDIPFAFKRMESLVFMSSLQEEILGVKESLSTLEIASKELRNSRLFLKLLEAVLKMGNRMNDGTFRGGAQAFKLDTLLKLADVKGTDGKTTLLHFVVQEIIRSEGVRAARVPRESQSISSIKSDDLVQNSPIETIVDYRTLGLEVVSGLGDELQKVRKAALLDADSLTSTVSKLGHGLVKTRDFLNLEMKSLDEDNGFHTMLKSFIERAEDDITWSLKEEKRIMALVKCTVDYFHGNTGKNDGLRLFVIVRDFLVMLDKACKEVRASTKKLEKIPPPTLPSSPDLHQPPPSDFRLSSTPDFRSRLFPAILGQRMDSFSSDDESLSP